MSKTVPIVEDILSANHKMALANRSKFDEVKLFALNLMASPGAGKTSLITETIKGIKGEYRVAYIDGDIATNIDAEKVAALKVPAVQINTGGQCHLDAFMIQKALPQLELKEIDLLIVENVGNLVCPTSFHLGVHRNVLIASIPEGDDKPYKYPGMYQGVDAIVLNKMDVLDAFDFRMDYFKRGVEILNPGLGFFPLSCKTGEGIDEWLSWVRVEVLKYKKDGNKSYEIR
jgi:hydrogenase nickel incorporation protein HypB